MRRVCKLEFFSVFSFSILFVSGSIFRIYSWGSDSYIPFILSAILSLLFFLSCRKLLVYPGFFLLGFSYCGIHAGLVVEQLLPESLDRQEVEISGFLLDFPRVTERGWQFDFYSEQLGGKVRLGLDSVNADQHAPDFHCKYTVKARLSRPRGLINFQLFDYQAWLLQAGYLATGYVTSLSTCESHMPDVVTAFRSFFADWIRSSDASEYAKSTLLGLLIGSYVDIDSSQWDLLKDSGTIHLLSVSGLHVVLVATLAYICTGSVVRWMVFPLQWMPAQWWAGVSAIFISVFYSLIAGFSIATQRSLVMVFVAILQKLFYGRFYFCTSLFASMLLIVVANPLSLLSSSFWFSFVATSILMLSSYGVFRMNSPLGSLYFISAIRLQFAIFMMMIPVMLYVYGKIPFLSLPMNLIAVPWVSFVSLPLAFLAAIILPLSRQLGDFFLELSGWSLDVYWRIMSYVIESPYNWQLSLGGISIISLLLCFFGLLIVFLVPAGLPLRVSGFFLCLPMLLPSGISLDRGEADVSVLDVGQGLAVIVRTARHALVYDVGNKSSERFDAGRDIVAAALRNMRVSRLDMLVISHGDSDHASGRDGLLREISTGQFWSGTPEQLTADKTYLPCRAGMHWRWDDVSFRVIWPVVDEMREDNNRGCVVMVEAGQQRFLLTADIEKKAEAVLVRSGVDLRADVLLAPHHGSKTSSSTQFIERVNPESVIVSAGFKNRFHHPAPMVMERYLARGIRVLNTADLGAVRLRLSANGVDIRAALCDRRYFLRIERYNAHCDKLSMGLSL